MYNRSQLAQKPPVVQFTAGTDLKEFKYVNVISFVKLSPLKFNQYIY